MIPDYSSYLQSIYQGAENFTAIGNAGLPGNQDKKLEIQTDPSGNVADRFVLTEKESKAQTQETKSKILTFVKQLIPGLNPKETIHDNKAIFSRVNDQMQQIQRDVNSLHKALQSDDTAVETLRIGLEALNKLKISFLSARTYLQDQEFDPSEANKLKNEIDQAISMIADKLQIPEQIDSLRNRITAATDSRETARSSLAAITSATSQVWKEQRYSLEREKKYREVDLGTADPVIIAREFIKGESMRHAGENINEPKPMQDHAGNWTMLPNQLSTDLPRYSFVTLNGELIYSSQDSSFNPVQVYRQITAAVSPGQVLNIQLAETKETADPGTLEGRRIGALMNQGYMADIFQKLNSISQEEVPPTTLMGGIKGGLTGFEINTTPTEVEIVYKMAFTRILKDDPEVKQGVIMVKRTLKIPFSELQKTNVDDIQMSVEDRISKPLASLAEAAEKLKEF